jgi:AcrR family transcriptional regulator
LRGRRRDKGAFFYHFKSKEELAVTAADHWSKVTGALFAEAPYHKLADPLERVLGYLDFRKALLQGKAQEFTCLVGTMVQETFATNPAIRDACDASLSGHAAKIEADIAEAMRQRRMRVEWSAESLALHTQASRAHSFWQKPRMDRRSPRRASNICAAISSFCSVELSRKEMLHENLCRDQGQGADRSSLERVHNA